MATAKKRGDNHGRGKQKREKRNLYTGDAKIAADNVAFCEKAVEDAKAALAQAKAELKEAYAKQRKEEREARARKRRMPRLPLPVRCRLTPLSRKN